MSLIDRDFAYRKVNNSVIEGFKATQRSKEFLKYIGAVALAAGSVGLGSTIYSASKDTEKKITWYDHVSSDMTVAQCSALENDKLSWSDYLSIVKEKNPGIEKTDYSVNGLRMPDTDGDGRICGETVSKKE